MNAINDRISRCVKASGLTKTAFAAKINVSQQHVSRLVKDGNPSDRTIADICREFNVNEKWLRTGQGEMFIQKNRNDEISEFIGEIMNGEPDFRQRFIAVLARMSKDEWEMLEQKILELSAEIRLKNNDNKETEKPTPQMTVEEAEAEYIKSRSKFAQNAALNASNTSEDTPEGKKKAQRAG